MPTSVDERATINRMLGSHGLGQLEDGAGLMAQLGYLVQDHEHLRSLLARCEPRYRRAMYDVLSAYVRFVAHPYEWYLAETARLAERMELPTVTAEGKFQPFKSKVTAIAQHAVERECGSHHLAVTCRSCTRSEVFSAYRKCDAIALAREAGWVYDELTPGNAREICPGCPAVRAAA